MKKMTMKIEDNDDGGDDEHIKKKININFF